MVSPFVYEDVLGGTNIYPSDISYGRVVLNRDVVYDWPLESAAGKADLLPRILDVYCNSYKAKSAIAVSTLLGPLAVGATQVVCTSSPAVSVGDFIIFDTTSDAPQFYIVQSVGTTTITLTSPIRVAYAAGATVYRFVFTPFSITLPSANETGTGQVVLINAIDSGAIFNVLTRPVDAPTTLLGVLPQTSWQVYLTDNATETGVWQTIQFGAQNAAYNAENLAGQGLTVSNTELVPAIPVTAFNTSPRYSSGQADRARALVWGSGAGTFYLPVSAAVGNNWFMHLRNQGTGLLVVTPVASGDRVNGASSLNLSPNESITVITDGLGNFYTLGYGRAFGGGSSSVGFDYTVINLNNQPSPFILSGNNLNRIAYNFVGALTSNMVVIVPQTIQQYWIANNTTGNFSFTIRTANTADAGKIVTQGKRAIYYSDGNFIQEGDNNSLALPLSIANGGTGAITAAGAITNLGATSIGLGVFQATTTPGAVLALGGTAVLDALTFSPQAKQFITFTNTTTALNILGGPNAINTYLGTIMYGDVFAIALALG